MAGWSKLDDDEILSSMHRCRTSESNGCLSNDEGIKLKNTFVELVSVFLKGTCPSDSFRPVPPMLGNGHCVDLLKLYFVVKQKGGLDIVSKNGLWDEVGFLYGLGSGFGSSIKLVYMKYLGPFESWLLKLTKDKNSKSSSGGCKDRSEVVSEGVLMELERDYSSFVSNISDDMRKGGGDGGSGDCYIVKVEKSDSIRIVDLTGENVVNGKVKRKKNEMGFANVVDLTNENGVNPKIKRKKVERISGKKVERSFASDVDLTKENDDNDVALKTKKVEVDSAKDVEFKKENNVDGLLQRMKSEMSSADAVSPIVSDARGSSVSPEVADNLVKNSGEMSFADAFWPDESDAQRSSFSPEVADNVVKSSDEMSFALDAISPAVSEARGFSVSPEVADNVVRISENSNASNKCSIKAEESRNLDSNLLKEEVSSRERKPDGLSRMLSWMAIVAKDPTDPVIGTVPESPSWAHYGNDNCWKQVLLSREALFMKRDQISSAEQSVWQKKQKMHPSMFDDQLEVAERLRSSPRLLSARMPHETDAFRGRLRQRLEMRLDMQPRASIYTTRPQQRIPVGRPFQAEVPEWTGVTTESDSKWLGTRVWPLEKRQSNLVIERDPIGKGRVDNCGCQFPGSTKCVTFHVSERRMKMKIELGSAFYSWNFDKMGEDCSISWTAEDEKKFKVGLKESPWSPQKRFWSKITKILPKKSWADLVNYYYNVFVLRRRGYQNRLAPKNIDSDDDETEYS